MKKIITVVCFLVWAGAQAKDSHNDSKHEHIGAEAPQNINDVDGELLSIDAQKKQTLIGGDIKDKGIVRIEKGGAIDPTFEKNWVAGGFNGPVHKVISRKNGSVVVAGDFTLFDTSLVGHIAVLSKDGTIDREFTKNTGVGFNGPVSAIQVEQDGSIVVAGDFDDFNGTSVGRMVVLTHDGKLARDLDKNRTIQGKITTLGNLYKKGLVLVGIEDPSKTSTVLKNK